MSLPAVNTFTGPITLVKGNNVNTSCLTIGGLRTRDENTAGTGSLGNGNYPGTISLDATTILNYLSSASQTLSGAISGVGAVLLDGSGTLTLSGLNTYSGNTTVNNGELVLATGGGLTFVLTDASNNKITGAGTATLDGSFTIDSSAVSDAQGSWTLVDVASKSFGATFSVPGFTDPDLDNVWTKVEGAQTWSFDESTGVLDLSSEATILTFGVPGSAGAINNNVFTIGLFVPEWTDLATLAPTFTLSSGTCDPSSGFPPSPTFADANPATYTVTDGATTNAYQVAVTVLSQTATVVIDLGTSPAGTSILGSTFGTYVADPGFPTNLPLPPLPAGSILRSIEVNVKLEATDADNWTSELTLLLDPTPGTPGEDFSVGISNGGHFGAALELNWPGSGDGGPGTSLMDTKTDTDWFGAGEIDLSTTGLFLGNGYGGGTFGGTWSGTITLTYDVAGYPGPTFTGITIFVPGEFLVSGSTDSAATIVTERATTLLPPDWTPIETNAVPGGAYNIVIPQAADPSAFYRFLQQ